MIKLDIQTALNPIKTYELFIKSRDLGKVLNIFRGDKRKTFNNLTSFGLARCLNVKTTFKFLANILNDLSKDISNLYTDIKALGLTEKQLDRFVSSINDSLSINDNITNKFLIQDRTNFCSNILELYEENELLFAEGSIPGDALRSLIYSQYFAFPMAFYSFYVTFANNYPLRSVVESYSDIKPLVEATDVLANAKALKKVMLPIYKDKDRLRTYLSTFTKGEAKKFSLSLNLIFRSNKLKSSNLD